MFHVRCLAPVLSEGLQVRLQHQGTTQRLTCQTVSELRAVAADAVDDHRENNEPKHSGSAVIDVMGVCSPVQGNQSTTVTEETPSGGVKGGKAGETAPLKAAGPFV